MNKKLKVVISLSLLVAMSISLASISVSAANANLYNSFKREFVNVLPAEPNAFWGDTLKAADEKIGAGSWPTLTGTPSNDPTTRYVVYRNGGQEATVKKDDTDIGTYVFRPANDLASDPTGFGGHIYVSPGEGFTPGNEGSTSWNWSGYSYQKMAYQYDFCFGGTNENNTIISLTVGNPDAEFQCNQWVDTMYYGKIGNDDKAAIASIRAYVKGRTFLDNANKYDLKSTVNDVTTSLTNGGLLSLGTWYTLRAVVDVPAKTIKLSIYNTKTGTLLYTTTSALNSGFVAACTGFRIGMPKELSTRFANTYVGKEYFYIKQAPQVAENGANVTATAMVGNDTYQQALFGAGTAGRMSPTLIIALFDKTTNALVGVQLDSKNILNKWNGDDRNPYEPSVSNKSLETLTASLAKPTGQYTAKAFLWDGVNTMIPYTGLAIYPNP